MTPAVALLAHLRARGVELVAIGDRLRFRPASAVSGDTREALRVYKAELLALLAAPPPPIADPQSFVRGARYAHPWPDGLPGLGPRRIAAFDVCADCGGGSWARFGDTVLCLPCAQQRERRAPA